MNTERQPAPTDWTSARPPEATNPATPAGDRPGPADPRPAGEQATREQAAPEHAASEHGASEHGAGEHPGQGQPGGPPTPPPGQAGWGAPPPPPENRSRWSVRRTVVAVAIALGIAAAGGVAIYAASGATENATGAGPRGGGPGGGMVVGGPLGDLSHGEFQNGEVTAISDDSITARSEDGYERTYVVDEDTELATGIEEGDDVMIVATVDGDTATARSVAEPGAMPKRFDSDGDGDGGPLVKRNPDDN